VKNLTPGTVAPVPAHLEAIRARVEAAWKSGAGATLDGYTKTDFVKAVAYHEQALAMYQRLYPVDRFPQGHPELAASRPNST
jgi:hypothetical protein